MPSSDMSHIESSRAPMVASLRPGQHGHPLAPFERAGSPVPCIDRCTDFSWRTHKDAHMKMSSSLTVVAAAPASSLAMHAAVAQTADKKAAATDKTAVLADKAVSYSDRERMKSWSGEKAKLEQSLKAGAGKVAYGRSLPTMATPSRPSTRTRRTTSSTKW